MINEHSIQLAAFQDVDVALFARWLNKDYIYKWFCCEGMEGEQACIDGKESEQEWLEETRSRREYPHRRLFIVTCDGNKIGFANCLDMAAEPEYMKEQYPDLDGKIKAGDAFELNYCIGEEAYLGKGIGKIIIRRLEEECRKLNAALLLADPNENNIPSVKVLLSNGFKKYKDCDYRKALSK